MSELRELYQEIILDHGRTPRNFGPLQDASAHAQGSNPLCGDQLDLHVRLDGDDIADVSFEGKGCAISTASASLMTQIVKGKTVSEATEIFERFHKVVTSSPDQAVDLAALGKLAALAGVREFPLRVKCASLAWHTLRAALDGSGDPVTTE